MTPEDEFFHRLYLVADQVAHFTRSGEYVVTPFDYEGNKCYCFERSRRTTRTDKKGMVRIEGEYKGAAFAIWKLWHDDRGWYGEAEWYNMSEAEIIKMRLVL